MKQNNNETNQPKDKWAALRYVSVFVVTIVLVVMAIASSGVGGYDTGMAMFFFILVFVSLFFITIPITGFWIYSFIKSVRRRTKTDRVLLFFHIADLLLIGLIIWSDISPARDCNAEIMAEHYEKEGSWMRNIAKYERLSLPDSTRLVIEFGKNEHIPQADYLDKQYLRILKNHLDDIGCIGIVTDNYQLSRYTTLRFRRKGMGLYSFLLYDEPLTLAQQDSLNSDECLIVYNDSTVFEFTGGVVGVQYFVGKQEFLDKRKKRHSTTDTIAAIERITNFEPGYNSLPIIDSVSDNKLRICPESDMSQIPDSVAYIRYLYADGKPRMEGWVAYFDDPEDDFSNLFGEWRYYDEQGNCYRKFWKYKENKQ